MKKIIYFSIIIFIILIVFINEKVIEKYFFYKISNWLERKIDFDEFKYNFPGSIAVYGFKVRNKDTKFYKNIFKADKIFLSLDLNSFFFKKLVLINELKIDKPEFYLDIVEKKISSSDIKDDKLQSTFKDNIGIAEKINNEIPDKVWPKKIRDVNFLILKSYIINGKAFIKISSLPNESKIKLSSFEFTNVGNDKKSQHYKSVLEIMFFDVIGRVQDFDKRKILTKVYNL
tara:strand:- start:91 stop:780 length:690 start_codon:yes stop_codon:yes gene_type:complete